MNICISIAFFNAIVIFSAFLLRDLQICNIYEWTIMVTGYVFAAWGQFYTVTKARPLKSNKINLVTDGPFKYVRHPYDGGIIIMSLAMIEAFIRSSIQENAIPKIFLAAPLVIPSLFFNVYGSLNNESKLRRLYGQQAEEYFKKVKKRWIPFVL